MSDARRRMNNKSTIIKQAEETISNNLYHHPQQHKAQDLQRIAITLMIDLILHRPFLFRQRTQQLQLHQNSFHKLTEFLGNAVMNLLGNFQ